MKIKLTELNSGYKGEKSVKAISEKNRLKIITALTLVIVFVFTYILSSVGIIPLDVIFLKARVSVSGDKDNFPIVTDDDSVLCFETVGDNIILLTTDNILMYSPGGKQILAESHAFSKPGITVNGNRAIVFDRYGKGFILIKDDKVVYTGEAENTIISAQYGKNGTYAISTKIEGATSALLVYNKSNENIFSWKCGFEYISNIAVSDNGRYIGAAVMGANDGEIFTTVHYFGIEYNEELNSQKISGVSPLALEFTGYNTLTLISDSGVYTIDRKADKYKKSAEYYASEFNSCDMSSNGKYIVTIAKYGSENVFETMLFSKDGDIKKYISTDFEIISTNMSDKYIFILGETSILVYNFRGNQVSEIKYKGEANRILVTDDFVFISSLNKLTRCYSYGDSTVEI